ncbi:MAG: aldose epimerase family protein [Niabella sp.]
MNEITTQSFGHFANEQEVFLFTLSNQLGTEVKITNYGAIITAIKLKKSDGTFNDIVLGFDEPPQYWNEEYLKNYPYFGAAIGRYGNRINKASFTIDEVLYKVNGQHPDYILHGGIEGFDKKVWDVKSTQNNKLVLQYISADGEEGFPGELKVQIAFELNDDNEFSYEYTVETSKTTAVNLTHHTYFNLNNGQGRIDNQHLKINASNYLEQDVNYCTTGNILSVKGTRNDFTTYRETGTLPNPETGIDISFPLDNPGFENVAAEAYCDEQDVKLEVYTTEPLVHLYNAYGSPTIIGKSGTQYTPFSGFCFETQVHPNAINIPSFPNTVLRPGEIYCTKTKYRFTTK